MARYRLRRLYPVGGGPDYSGVWRYRIERRWLGWWWSVDYDDFNEDQRAIDWFDGVMAGEGEPRGETIAEAEV